MNTLFDTTAMRAAKAALTGLSRRQEAISANVANIDTPGYTRRAVSFEGALEAEVMRSQGAAAPGELVRTDAAHLAHRGGSQLGGAGASGDVTRDVVSARNDGNTVSVDEEMLLLVETQLRYQALTQSVGRRLSTLRSVIRG
ncbi:MAG: flagellar basal body rod protein FlgB [Dehalococcoidia bacterium]|nr:flagellar basal body rod protein FlgB [Dehalococcoidia bacterium]